MLASWLVLRLKDACSSGSCGDLTLATRLVVDRPSNPGVSQLLCCTFRESRAWPPECLRIFRACRARALWVGIRAQLCAALCVAHCCLGSLFRVAFEFCQSTSAPYASCAGQLWRPLTFTLATWLVADRPSNPRPIVSKNEVPCEWYVIYEQRSTEPQSYKQGVQGIIQNDRHTLTTKKRALTARYHGPSI